MTVAQSKVALALVFGGVCTLAWAEARSLDAPLPYTVKVASPTYGSAQETRSIASGQSDDYTWKTVPPSGPQPADARCPGINDLPLDSNHAVLRQVQVRLAPVVNANGVATVQLSFQGHAPRGARDVKVGGTTMRCPVDAEHHQVIRFTMTVDGPAKTVRLEDGTTITVSATRPKA